MGCGASSDTADIQYNNGKPTVTGDEVIKGFNSGNGLLFRIIDNKKKRWAYYNDTKEYEMHIKVNFNKECKIQALGKTNIQPTEDGGCVASIVVYPMETELFVEGTINGFKSKMDALPLSDEYLQRQRETQ